MLCSCLIIFHSGINYSILIVTFLEAARGQYLIVDALYYAGAALRTEWISCKPYEKEENSICIGREEIFALENDFRSFEDKFEVPFNVTFLSAFKYFRYGFLN